MKLMIASDIHGSAYYCEQLMNCVQKEKPDKILLLGDLLYHGPRNDLPRGYDPKKVISMLNSAKSDILCVRGNCDTEVDQMVLEFPVLADYALLCIDGCTLYATHGHVYNESNILPAAENSILLGGHTHVPGYKKTGSILYVNPGSVSIPKNGSQNQYLIFENRQFIFKNLSSDILDCLAV
ncbi:MAG: phosphodiesterase [Oscillospiraceae bacterium]|nr:phosphodiesterase [Oscillospiraceae bacterium]